MAQPRPAWDRRLALHVLASGSRGNAAIVEDRRTGASLIIDCGICKRDFFSRAAALTAPIDAIEALLITHDHSDHTKGLGVVLRGFIRQTGRLPLYASERVCRASSAIREVIEQGLVEYRPLTPEGRLTVGPFSIEAFATSHDAAESFGFSISISVEGEGARGDKLGYVTDTGTLSDAAIGVLQGSRLLALESNHDAQMLIDGPYPAYLKARVGSAHGHLSNAQAAEALSTLAHPGLESVAAMHVSQNNNTYQRAKRALFQAIAARYPDLEVSVAYQDRPITIR